MRKVKFDRQILYITLFLVLFVWFIDSILDYLFFYEESFLDVFLFELTSYEIYFRVFVVLVILIFGILNSYIIANSKETEALLRIKDQAITSSISAISIADLKGKIEYANKTFIELFGLEDTRKAIGINLNEITTPPINMDTVTKILYTKRNWSGELFAKRNDDEIVTVLLAFNLITNGHGEPIKILGTGLDLSMQKSVENELLHRADLDNMISKISNIFIDVSHDDVREAMQKSLKMIGQFTEVDRTQCFIVNEENGEWDCACYWQNSDANIGDKDNNGFRANTHKWWFYKLDRHEKIIIDDVRTMPVEASFEKEALIKQGIKSVLAVPLILEHKLIGSLSFDSFREPKRWNSEDVKLLEIIANVFTTALIRTKAEQSLRLQAEFVKQNPSPVIRTNLQGVITFGNPSAVKVFNSDLSGKEVYSLFPNLAKNKINNLKLDEICEFTQIIGKETYLFTVKKEPELECFFIYGFNITNQKKYESEIININNELKELNSTKDRFFSIIANDLKNSFLSAIDSSEQIAKYYNDYSPDLLAEKAVAIFSSTRKLNDMMENLLQWSRIQIGRDNGKYKSIRIDNLIEEIFVSLNEYAQNKNIALINETKEEIKLETDEVMLKIVIKNLINNAIKFSYPFGKVYIDSKIENGRIYISVADEGIGISDENLHKLFDLNKRIVNKDLSIETGTGLGLLLCKDYVDKNDGVIQVESKYGKGSKFTIALPLG